MVFCTALLLLIMVTIHAVLPDVTDALPHHLERSRPSRRSSSSSSSTRSRTRSSELEDWDSGQSSPNLFSNVLLSYDKVKDQEEEEASNKGDDLKSWLSRKFQQLVVASRAAVEKDEEDQEAVESDLELAVPRSPNSNEIYLPIDFNLLMPKPDNSSSSTLEANDDLMTNFVDSPEESSEHLFSETAQAPIYLAASVEDDRRPEKHAFNFGKQQNKNKLKDSFSLQNLRNDGTFEYRTRPAVITTSTTTTTTTTRPTTQRTPVATVASIINSGRSAYSSTSSTSTPSSKSTSTTTTLESRNISPSYDLPERRFLMTYPVRRLLMAYFAPRILRFQMAMLLNSVIGEVSRKIIDPFIGSRFGIKTAASSSNSAVAAPSSASSSSSSSSSPSSSPLSLVQLAQTLSSPLSSISSLAGIAQQLSGGGGGGGGNAAPASPVPAAAAAPLAASPAASSSSLNALLSSALSGGGGGGGGGISQATINSLLGQLTDSDMKQMLAMAGLGGGQQSQPEIGGLGGGMVAAGSAPPVGHLVPSNVDYDEDSSEEEMYTDDSDLMPT